MRITAIFFFLVLTRSVTFSSPYDESARRIIEQKLTSDFQRPVGLHALVNVDTAQFEKSNMYTQTEVENPYGTLDHCSLFVCGMNFKKDSTRFVVGVFKNNSIIWYSEIPTALDGILCLGEILGVRDLNADGKVELMYQITERGGEGAIWNLWIFSWDGTTGTMINDINQEGMSVINGSYLLPVDYNGDGILEIRDTSNEPNQVSPVVWSWNGSKYGAWSDTPQPGGSFRLRKNAVADIHCSVTKTDPIYQYAYSILNKPESKRRIEDFYINTSGKIISADSLKNIGWTPCLPMPTYPFIHWSSDLNWSTWKQRLLKIGEWWNGFIARSSSLPGIVNFYVQSEQFTSDGNYNTMDDIFNNSTSSVTISPQQLPDPFVPIGFLDTLNYYTIQSRSLGWIKDQGTADKYLGYFSSARIKLAQKDSVGARIVLLQALKDVDIDSTTSLSSETYALLRYNTEYLANRLPQAQAAPFFAVKLVSSTGTKLTSGALQYYEGAWKDATNNQDGTFSINTSLKTLSLRMTYEYGTQTKSNVSISNDTIVFQTVNAQIQLQNSSGNLIDTGSVQYYAGAWRILGTTINGVANKELLPGNYTFRITYAYASKDKQQDLGTNATVIFQTVNANVQLQNSQGSLMDQGIVQYYSGAWRDLGTTANGIATKELLPNNYSFRMSYAFASKDKQQDISTNPTVVFQTVSAAVQLKNSQGSLMDQGTVQYYSGAWRDIGTTTNGVATKELLPNNYSFRMSYAYASKDKQQDISTNATVVFQTISATVQLQNSQGALMDQGTVQYYSGAWRDFGTTTNGIVTKELLSNNYSFRMTYAFASKDKQQDISTNATVVFQTVNTAVQFKNSLGNLIDQGTVQYYSGAWRILGTTTNGTASKELLPNNYSFRMTYEYVSVDKAQDISTNSIVSFLTVLCTIKVKNSQNQPVDNALASYYSGAWRQIGNTVNGEITKELLPVNLSFRVKYGTQQQDKQQNLSTNNVVEFGIQ